ncbi:hypothetical protein P691DRAFT_798988 [Macrolepiota fuliginosa MF-IS2]|uniref:Nephrocystin 3-like N-terminal domain-containing protein n=1 Tax=Macrolepiota fuliginosa MF-IS2 TaxID=1400762 RepID=A0A9P5WZS7_9AGAR|nr:hypothetical protein P691DRAFT_798988 [Macrolepiota fuliginosa MF-IS2]
MDYLANNKVGEAEFDSPLRMSPPQCQPGSQRGTIDLIRTFILHPSRQRSGLVWVHGRAGVGKSASLHTLAGELQGELAATFFFPKTGICESRRVFLTVAHQLAVRYPPYRSYLDDCMRMDPAFLDKTSETLIQTLFITPTFYNMFPIDPNHRHVIIIDGLDSQGSRQQQSKFLGLVCRYILDHPASPFVWIISSRPEERLRVKFSEIEKLHLGYKEIELDPNSEQACEDVKRYLRDGFKRIRDHFPDATPSGPWPACDQLLKVASVSSGFFPFACATLDFVGQSTLGGPVSRLNHVLTLLDNPESTAVLPASDLFHPLDTLYSPIMSEIPPTELPCAAELTQFNPDSPFSFGRTQ